VVAVRCPIVVGRDAETGALRRALAAARAARGGTVVVSGPPGIGKTRLARELAETARDDHVPVLIGRAVERDSTAFRPFGEALQSGLRQSALRHSRWPDLPELEPFRPALGRLLPQWRLATTPVDDSLPMLGEAVLRLLSALAGDVGLLLVLDDLQWADAESLAVLEYVADNVADERILLVGTTRERPAEAHELAGRLAARDACRLLAPLPLNSAQLAEMAAACRGAPVECDVVDVLRRRTDGTPLLVEELLAADGNPASTMPATVAGLVARRLADLPPVARQCTEAAAVFGERFDWTLLGPVLDADASAIREGLRAVVADGLVERDGDGFRFHHALGRDAVLAGLLPPEREDLARRALAAVAGAHPGLEDAWCGVAAELAVSAGDTARAAEVLVEAGRRNLSGGALASAESALTRAHDLLDAPGRVDLGLAVDADDLLGEVLALAGRTDEAVAVTRAAIDRLVRLPDADCRLAEAHLRLTRIYETAGDHGPAGRALEAARNHAQHCADDDLRLRVDGVAARLALDSARFGEAHTLATAALAGLPAVECDALMVLGRIARRDDPAVAERLFARARRVADDAGLVVLAARALREESISDVQESLRVDRLHEARARALTVGDLAAVAVLDLQLVAVHVTRWEIAEATAAAGSSVGASRRFRLATLPKALVLGAVADLQAGRTDAADAALAEAVALAPNDTHLLGETWGVRALRALADADDARALGHLQRAVAAFARRPNEVSGSPAVGLWVLLSVVLDRDLDTAPEPPDPVANRWNRGLVAFAGVVVRGRAGDAVGAAAGFAAADAMLRDPVDAVWFRLQARRLVATAALADGWGDPAAWVAEDLPVVEARGEDRWATALRGLLRRAGAVVSRRGRGDASVPAELRTLGITSRETDVLLLIAEGRGNREVAEHLYLSPRTVEKHVERLLSKTGLARRNELVVFAARTFAAAPRR
jgi:DNA-binding CsgD family transcriptional regulator/tetratricopeptide (TPR) repeat protein